MCWPVAVCHPPSDCKYTASVVAGARLRTLSKYLENLIISSDCKSVSQPTNLLPEIFSESPVRKSDTVSLRNRQHQRTRETMSHRSNYNDHTPQTDTDPLSEFERSNAFKWRLIIGSLNLREDGLTGHLRLSVWRWLSVSESLAIDRMTINASPKSDIEHVP
jgi:hypothetical protein